MNGVLESKAVLAGGAIATVGYILFYMIYGVSGTPPHQLIGTAIIDPTTIFWLILLVTCLPGPFVAGYLQSQDTLGGVIHGTLSALLGLIIPFLLMIFEEIFQFFTSSEGSDSVLFDELFVGLMSFLIMTIVAIVIFTGAIGGAIGGLAGRLNESSTK